MSEELKITKTAVLAAAAKCPDAKRILETMFPEVFEKPKPIIRVSGTCQVNGGLAIEPRSASNYGGVSFYLHYSCTWRIEKDNEGLVCLIPTPVGSV